MNLELYSADLAPEHRKTSADDVTFDKLSKKAQDAVRVVGQAMYYGRGGNTRKIVYPPK